MLASLGIAHLFFDSSTSQTYGQLVIPKQGDLGQVWISGYDFARNIDNLQKHHIGAVCTAAGNLTLNYPSKIVHISFDISDHQNQYLQDVFLSSYQFIETQRRRTNVLVHCLAGVSRSASVLIAYMIRKYRWDYDKCLEMLKSKRKCCMPNYGFRQQLLELEEGLGKGSAYQSEKQ